jgi:hypothetical protein
MGEELEGGPEADREMGIEESRTISHAELIKGGANWEQIGDQKILTVTPEQAEQIYKDFNQKSLEEARRLLKTHGVANLKDAFEELEKIQFEAITEPEPGRVIYTTVLEEFSRGGLFRFVWFPGISQPSDLVRSPVLREENINRTNDGGIKVSVCEWRRREGEVRSGGGMTILIDPRSLKKLK